MKTARFNLGVLFMLVAALATAGCVSGYGMKHGRVTYISVDAGSGRSEVVIHGADPASFVVLASPGYAKDKNQVYHKSQPIQGADPATFVALSRIHAKDMHHAYASGQRIEGADLATFTELDLNWSRDKNRIYLHGKVFDACHPASFSLLRDSWEIDDRCAYKYAQKIQAIDRATFKVINSWYAKDKSNVYSAVSNSPIPGADPETFRVGSPCIVCARDKNRCYNVGKVVDCKS